MKHSCVCEFRTPGIIRKTTVDTSSCRIIFGEADFPAGLVIDKYEDVLVVECLALGMEQFKGDHRLSVKRNSCRRWHSDPRVSMSAAIPMNVPKKVFRRVKQFIGEEFDTNVEIVENGVHYMVDVVNGQKTGFFLDQIQPPCHAADLQRQKGAGLLHPHGNLCTERRNRRASEVTGLDISEYAVAQAEANARLNHLENTVHFRCANVLDELPKLAAAGENTM